MVTQLLDGNGRMLQMNARGVSANALSLCIGMALAWSFLSGQDSIETFEAHALLLRGCEKVLHSEIEKLEREYDVDGRSFDLSTRRGFHRGISGVVRLSSATFDEFELRKLLLSFEGQCYPNATMTLNRTENDPWEKLGERISAYERASHSRMFVNVDRSEINVYFRYESTEQ